MSQDEGTTSGSGSERRTPEKEDDASSEGEVYSTVTDKGPKGSAGNSAVAGAPRDTAASLDAGAHSEMRGVRAQEMILAGLSASAEGHCCLVRRPTVRQQPGLLKTCNPALC